MFRETDLYFGNELPENLLDMFKKGDEKSKEMYGEEPMNEDCNMKKPFKNPNKFALDALHLEITWLEKIKDVPDNEQKDDTSNFEAFYKKRTEVIPALDKRWLTKKELLMYQPYQPYYPQFSREENYLFKISNTGFCQTLEDLLEYDFHIFWCVISFSEEVPIILNDFIKEPVYIFDYDRLGEEERAISYDITINSLHVYQRLIRFKQSETEFLNEDVGMRILISGGYLTTPIIVNLAMLYQTLDEQFMKTLISLYYCPKRKDAYTKELREMLTLWQRLLEVLHKVTSEGQMISINSPFAAIRNRPAQFDPHWAQEVAANLLKVFYSLSSFLPLLDDAVEIAIELNLAKIIPMVYNSVFAEIEAYMEDRASVPAELLSNFNNYVKVGRGQAVKAFDAIVSYCIKKIVDLGSREKEQETLVDVYMEWMQEALEYEFFINDYNSCSSVALQIDQIVSFYPNIEYVRASYIKSSIETIVDRLNNPQQNPKLKKLQLRTHKLSDLWNNLWQNSLLTPTPKLDSDLLSKQEMDWVNGETETPEEEGKPDEKEIESMINSIMETLPHLGDGFVLQCLQHYSFNVTDTLAAILDENLPPHLAEIPFDTIRIPEEKDETPQPISAHKGKREDYSDALQLIDDKIGIKDIKELIVVNSMINDDELDDTLDDLHIEDVVDEARVLRHLEDDTKNLSLVSDPSDDSSEEETNVKKRDAFCEDPAIIRARREAQRMGGGSGSGKGKSRDVVGKPKGQGQDKDVQHNRDKKNVHKSSRANHNRKGGAQWKRSKGMVPS